MLEKYFGKSEHELLLRYFGHPVSSFIKGRGTFSVLKEKRRLLNCSGEEIQTIQFVKLKRVLIEANRYVPFYREKFGEIGFDPERMTSLDEYRNLDFSVTKSDIRPDPSRFISERARADRLSWHRTGGSTGEPLYFATDPRTDGASHASLILALNMSGADVGDRHCLFWGSPTFIRTRDGLKQKAAEAKLNLRNRLMNKRVILNYNISEKNVVEIYNLLEHFRPKYIRGMPASMYAFSRLLRSENLSFKNCKPFFIHSACETLFDLQRDLIESCFNCKVLNTYGLSEFGDIAFQVPSGEFLVMEDDAFLELKEIDGGASEIIASQLNNMSCPLLKYRTGDVADAIVRSKRNVGYSSLVGLKGRAHDFVRASDGRYLHGQFFTHILVGHEGIEQYRIHQDREYNVKILLVTNDDYVLDSEKQISRSIKSYLGDDTTVRFQYVDRIPLTDRGKHKWIISEVNSLDNRPA